MHCRLRARPQSHLAAASVAGHRLQYMSTSRICTRPAAALGRLFAGFHASEVAYDPAGASAAASAVRKRVLAGNGQRAVIRSIRK